jgi:hypothetical protein
MEIETMSAKVLPALVVGLLLGTTAFAAAQTIQPGAAQTIQPGTSTKVVYRGPYYYWTDPYYGTPYDNVYPYSASGMPDPYRGTVYDGIAPY